MVINMACLLFLRRCKLLKYARLEIMKEQEDLLSCIIQWWDEKNHIFHIGGHDLTIEKEDIYFLTSRSCRGPRPYFTGLRADPRTTMGLIPGRCTNKTMPVSNPITKTQVAYRLVRSFLWMFIRLVGAKSRNFATKAQVLLALDFRQPQIFN